MSATWLHIRRNADSHFRTLEPPISAKENCQVLDFKPPKDSPILIRTAKFVLPLIFKSQLHGATLEVVGDGIERFKELSGRRSVICPNHAHRHDPHMLMEFS